ncbi:hypothetical protein B0T26DRAFT_675908 [Lasiosphaeria miniovina]|uniref:Uncharacterized protein n=1 Tax=Lasiosphaeria miniovina TaxID=1954250 RepID=A0AA40AKQ6_9PEZI|nr:uncharacterized protein B0T26DRAFT_675908 [Lasiosphaeria miniovina]KAK0717632.1 hypothetical protein B0T26DRAFT_675908 [Lasiosphaeria miniovina]
MPAPTVEDFTSDSDDHGPSTLYSYAPSRGISKNLSNRGSVSAASGDEGDSDIARPPELETTTSRAPPAAYHVFEFRYVGDGTFGGQHSAELSVVSDTKENALYAFTIVTIIFLPLSAVSSIFGVNISDFRDMEQGQCYTGLRPSPSPSPLFSLASGPASWETLSDGYLGASRGGCCPAT